MGWAIFTSVASLASIVALALQLHKNHEKPRVYLLLVVSLLLSVLAGVFWSSTEALKTENKKLSFENTQLQLARNKAQQLVKSWPKPERFDFTSCGEFRGIVLSGMAFLEKHKEVFPDTYKTAKFLFISELGVGASDNNNWYEERHKLQESAEAIVLMMKSIQLDE